MKMVLIEVLRGGRWALGSVDTWEEKKGGGRGVPEERNSGTEANIEKEKEKKERKKSRAPPVSARRGIDQHAVLFVSAVLCSPSALIEMALGLNAPYFRNMPIH